MAEQSCPQCGTTYPYEDEICPSCGYQVPPPSLRTKKSPWISAILSVFFFGAGQVYNGQIKKGIAFLILTFAGIFALLIPGILVWLYGIYDAAVTSRNMNRQETLYLPTPVGKLALFILIVFLIDVGIGIVVAGYAAG